jgi:hypothetical protein
MAASLIKPSGAGARRASPDVPRQKKRNHDRTSTGPDQYFGWAFAFALRIARAFAFLLMSEGFS